MTAIEWTDATWNPVTGCDRVSPGCAHCYALTLAARLKAMGQPRYQRDGDPKTSGPGFGVTLHADKLDEPLHWRKPRRVFVNSMSDLFHEEIPTSFILEAFYVMLRARQHTFQVLTKRPERARRVMDEFYSRVYWGYPSYGDDWEPLRNVWLGVSVENARWAHRADVLREIPAAVRFISAEPLLGSLDALNLDGIDWLIVGGESGKGARPMEIDWARELRAACANTGTAFFFKQWGGPTPKSGGRLLDGRTWDEMPAAVERAA